MKGGRPVVGVTALLHVRRNRIALSITEPRLMSLDALGAGVVVRCPVFTIAFVHAARKPSSLAGRFRFRETVTWAMSQTQREKARNRERDYHTVMMLLNGYRIVVT